MICSTIIDTICLLFKSPSKPYCAVTRLGNLCTAECKMKPTMWFQGKQTYEGRPFYGTEYMQLSCRSRKVPFSNDARGASSFTAQSQWRFRHSCFVFRMLKSRQADWLSCMRTFVVFLIPSWKISV